MPAWGMWLIICGTLLGGVALGGLLLRRYGLERGVAGLAGFAYETQQRLFYARQNAWQRRFGYDSGKDAASIYAGMVLDCEPVYFDYGGRHWLIELWKGQYGLTAGAEIGVYSTRRARRFSPAGEDITHYDAVKDADMLPMAMRLIHKGDTLFTRSGRCWWLTGFLPGHYAPPEELTLSCALTFPDFACRDAFADALHVLGYVNMTVRGNTVWLLYERPHSPSPATYTPRRETAVLARNRRLCEAYRQIAYTGTEAGKLAALREADPWLYYEATRSWRGARR